MNFKIKKNERAALMGLNGAGKTTIVKLILKLYEPESGVILLNGHNIQEYDDSYLSNISVVFQDCKVFPLTIKENIGASNIMENVYESCQRTSFDDVLNKKKITLDNLCDAEIYENGAEFSGGEKQLMAITRAVHRNGELIIMDEPSSALDPIMRNRLLLQYRSMTNHHTSLLITHDLTLAKQCDLILEIIQGEVIVHDRKSYAF